MPVDLEIVSPEKLLLAEPVDMVTLPAAEGEMGVLPGHAPMIVLLRGGTVRTWQAGKVVQSLYVSGGFAEVTGAKVTVLANAATPVADLSRAEAEKRLAEAESAYAALDKSDMAATLAAMDAIQSARAMVEAAPAA
jgi:F-type H+-transporting ATPase subunit epsilon